MLNDVLEYARSHRERHLDQLFELLRIPSVSTLPEHEPDMQRAAEWLAADLSRVGVKNVGIMPTGGHPAVYGEWLDAGDDAPTVLVYGHYDVQPVDPLELWDSPPFEPEIRDGKIYARGTADDKGQLFIHAKAVESMLAVEDRLPVNVKFLLEGEEEIGSVNLGAFVREHRDLLACDSVLISDTAFLTLEQPLIISGLRGIVGAEILIGGPKHDLHSGAYGGTVHNPVQALAEIIAALHDETGKVTIPGFYDKVRPLSDAEREAMAQVPYTLEKWQSETGLEIPWGEPDYTLLERIGARPTCEVNGIWGGFQGVGGKTIIPAEAGAKFTMRLVPDQVPDEIVQLFADYVMSIAPESLDVEVHPKHGGDPVVVPIDAPEIVAASKAYKAVWGVAPVFMRGGGTIGVVATFQRELSETVVMMGFASPDSGGHAPNEHFHLDNFYRGIEAAIHYYHNLAG